MSAANLLCMWYRHRFTAVKQSVGSVEFYSGLLRWGRVRHVHLVSPDAQFAHCVPLERVEYVLASRDYWEAQRRARVDSSTDVEAWLAARPSSSGTSSV